MKRDMSDCVKHKQEYTGAKYKEGWNRVCWLYFNNEQYRKKFDGEKSDALYLKSEHTAQEPPGPGTELKGLLESFGVSMTEDCQCARRAKLMNRWGVAKCREYRNRIIGWLEEEAKERKWRECLLAGLRSLTHGVWVNPLNPYGSLVDEAIRRAAAKEAIARGEL